MFKGVLSFFIAYFLHVFIFVVCIFLVLLLHSFFFFFNDTATTEIYTLSLHDALPILSAPAESWSSGASARSARTRASTAVRSRRSCPAASTRRTDHGSTRSARTAAIRTAAPSVTALRSRAVTTLLPSPFLRLSQTRPQTAPTHGRRAFPGRRVPRAAGPTPRWTVRAGPRLRPRAAPAPT